jgi:hypothetical protein
MTRLANRLPLENDEACKPPPIMAELIPSLLDADLALAA